MVLFACFGYFACDIVESTHLETTDQNVKPAQIKKVAAKKQNSFKSKNNKLMNRQCKLMRAIQQNNFDKISSLLSLGFKPDTLDDLTGLSPLHYLVENNQLDLLKFFLRQGVNVDAQDAHGNSLLHVAVQKGFVDMIDTLLFCCARVNVVNLGGETALHAAAASGNLRIITMLLDAGADMHATNNDGELPLQYARLYAKDWGQSAQELYMRMEQEKQKKNFKQAQLARQTSRSRKLSTIQE